MQVCFVALNAYPAIDPSIPGAIGGIETRSWTFARAIAQHPSVTVNFAIRHAGKVRQTTYSGVRIVPLIDRLLGIRHAVATRVDLVRRFPFLKLKQWSWHLLWQMPLLAIVRPFKRRAPEIPLPHPTLLQLQTDLYCTFGVQSTSAQVIATGKSNGRPVILILGSDGDLDPIFQTENDQRDQFGTTGRVGHFVLTQADLIVAQTPSQQQRLRDQFQREATLIENPIDVNAWDAGLQQPSPLDLTAGLDRYVLWIGRSDSGLKRPEHCIAVARLCPDVRFLMVMNPYDPIVEARVRQTAPPNVRILEKVPFETMPALFKRAAVLMNTSKLEGFPNTYLQAAVSQVPIASLVVQKDYIDTLDLGFCAEGDVDALAQFVRETWATPRSPARTQAARERVMERHDLNRLSAKHVDTCRELIQSHHDNLARADNS